ncbi:phosphatase PAP2 family protein [Clostridium chauvoei]|uniref:Phosphatase PAP2 family protein n=2 Tax=Clostridium chauvoei TaxID=46867 RepID=A0ABD4RFI4_9CLOT|nr:phosphatase PAP2 family protein [Clostridium chauvoei]ATD55700.1 phosphatase PAP2 family protein [Clostridium chauvoei]MBX7280057.1 phosphatase PAP2 family protein [Clostridium chauvoei]MBX7282541.1 phosphatase PAP2 family protein [Clostridium chauvoei]MBX7284948.1 phosphatase PAP2 family protein [Clostridium chauvoei]MBX7287454.1 phosphatase PAP2 family protein [Clostridium chauvoei]
MLQLIQNLDVNILTLIRENLTNPFLDKIMKTISSLGSGGLIWIVIAVILLCIKKYRKVGITLILALIIMTILGEGIIKHLVQRPRPFLVVPDIELIVKAPMSYSFPSGHTGSSFAAAFVLSSYFKDKKYLFLGIATLMGFSRLYLFVHYPSDVIAGVIVGFISYKVASILINKIFTKKYCGINSL